MEIPQTNDIIVDDNLSEESDNEYYEVE